MTHRIVDHFETAKRSPSAEMVAVLRAAHQTMDQPVVHVDALAARIIGAQGRRWMEANPKLLSIEYVRDIRWMVAIRSRFCEDALREAVARGVRQYVLLGAGLDTFAYRQPEFARKLTIFEVDEGGTQAWKLERLEEAGIEPPSNLRFVPVNFNEGMLARRLDEAGFDRSVPAFFAWLGVSYYLPRESILETLRFIAEHEAPGEVVFDIALEESAISPGMKARYRELRQAMAAAAEPWQTWLAPEEVREMLHGLGFTDVQIHDSNELIGRFVTERRDLSVIAMVVARKD